MSFEEFSPAAIACAIGWMAAGADRQLRGDYFTRWATALLADDNPRKFTFEQLTDFENEIRRRYESAGLAHIAPNLAAFVAHNNFLRARRLSTTTAIDSTGGTFIDGELVTPPAPGDRARDAGRPLYADECPACRQDPCACEREPCRHFRLNEDGTCRRCGADRRGL